MLVEERSRAVFTAQLLLPKDSSVLAVVKGDSIERRRLFTSQTPLLLNGLVPFPNGLDIDILAELRRQRLTLSRSHIEVSGAERRRSTRPGAGGAEA